MARGSSALAMVGMLGLGLGLGLTLGRVPALIVTARQAPAPSPAPRAAADPWPARPAGEAALRDELERQYSQFAVIDRTFTGVARAVSPSVVHIIARKRSSSSHGPYEESGSGVIVRPDDDHGLVVLTNQHVVEGAEARDVTITLFDGRTLKTPRVWTDRKADVAVLFLEADDLPAARLGDSDTARVGTWVLALGSPFGLSQSVSQGIISARNRHEQELEDDGVENQEFLQTDAAINPGNSGGPLVNLRGEVIGINTAIASNGGGNEGVGFSIPINLARWVMRQLVERGKVSRGALGVHLHDVDPEFARQWGLDRPRGASILSVERDSPAAKAGLRSGDVVLRYNGKDVANINHLINLVSQSPIGQEAELELWRDRKAVVVRVPIADQEAVLNLPPPSRQLPRSEDGTLRRPRRPAPTEPADGGGR